MGAGVPGKGIFCWPPEKLGSAQERWRGNGGQLYVAAGFTRRARTQTQDLGQNGCWGWRNIVAVRNAALHCEGGEQASLLKESPWAQCLEVLVQILGCD